MSAAPDKSSNNKCKIAGASEIWVLVERYAIHIGIYRRFGKTYGSHLQE